MYDSASVLASATRSAVLRGRDESAAMRASTLSTLATVVVVAVGMGLRLWRPDLAQVNFDESNVASLVAAWKYQEAFPVAGTVSSYGFRAAQGWPWFAAIGLQPSDDPYALVGVGLLAGLAGLVIDTVGATVSELPDVIGVTMSVWICPADSAVL